MLHVQVLLGIFVRQARRTRPPGGGAVQRRSPVRSLLRPRRVRPKGRRRREIPGSPLGARQRTMRLERRRFSWRARDAPHDRRERPPEAHLLVAAAVDATQRGLAGGELEVMRVGGIVGRRRHIWERLLPQGVGFGHLAHLDGDFHGSDRVAEEHRLLSGARYNPRAQGRGLRSTRCKTSEESFVFSRRTSDKVVPSRRARAWPDATRLLVS